MAVFSAIASAVSTFLITAGGGFLGSTLLGTAIATATGYIVAGGLAAAFNAPLAGIMFVVEEMRPQFRYSLISIKAVIISAISANIVFRSINGQSYGCRFDDIDILNGK